MTSQHEGRTPSDEADKAQLAMARKEGDAYQASLAYMVDEVADTGTKKLVGDYIVAIAQERAEGMYHLKDKELVWVEPTHENCHVEVSVSDSADKRFVPGLDIEVTLVKGDGGDRIGPVAAPFLWHPGLYHYGVSVRVPGDGPYAVTVRIAAPSFGRHDKVNGKRYARPVDVTFENVQVKVGQE